MTSVRHNWHAYREHLRCKYLPRLANWLVSLSTERARRILKRAKPIHILIDNTVLNHAIAHETAWVSTGICKWGTNEFSSGYAARISVHSSRNDSERYESVKYLPGIGLLAQQGHMKLQTSAELRAEVVRQPVGRYAGYGYLDYNLLGNVRIGSVDDLPPVTITAGEASELTAAAQRKRLDRIDDPLYRSIVKSLGRSNSQDAWHICTAEAHGMFCFLTMDFRLRRAVEDRLRREPFKSLRTCVMTPAELGRHLGISPVPTDILSHNGASFFVRSDLCWPEERRQPRRRHCN